MTKRKWQIIGLVWFIVYMAVFGFFLANRFEKTAWFVILPLGMLLRYVWWCKKPNSN